MLIILTFVCAISLTSCKSSGVDASLTAVSTATRVTVTATFGTNKNLKSGDAVPHVKQYKYNSDSNKYVYDNVDLQMTFENSVYTTSNQVFSSLDESTKYKFKLFITYKSKDKKAAEVECTTKAKDEATPISSISDFQSMSDDLNGNYILTDDLDFDTITDSEFTSPFSSSEIFKGTFNGNGHTISNINLKSASTANGIFAYCDGAKIFDLNIKNVKANYTSGLSSVNFGVVIGYAKNCVIYNVNVDNVDFDAQGNSTSTINIGGIVGLSEGCSIINSNVSNADFYFTRLRCKVSAGGLIGQAIKFSNESLTSIKEDYTKLIDAATAAVLEGSNDSLAYINAQAESALKDEKILAYDCTADSSFGGVLYYLSKTDSGDAFTHIGGFIGDVSTHDTLPFHVLALEPSYPVMYCVVPV